MRPLEENFHRPRGFDDAYLPSDAADLAQAQHRGFPDGITTRGTRIGRGVRSRCPNPRCCTLHTSRSSARTRGQTEPWSDWPTSIPRTSRIPFGAIATQYTALVASDIETRHAVQTPAKMLVNHTFHRSQKALVYGSHLEGKFGLRTPIFTQVKFVEPGAKFLGPLARVRTRNPGF